MCSVRVYLCRLLNCVRSGLVGQTGSVHAARRKPKVAALGDVRVHLAPCAVPSTLSTFAGAEDVSWQRLERGWCAAVETRTRPVDQTC